MAANGRNSIIVSWVVWQLYEVPAFLFRVWWNYLAFTENFFSVGFLLRTLFQPWRHYNWRYPKVFDLYEFSLALTSNIFSRFLGALMRIVLIVFGIALWFFVAVIGAVVIIVWYLAPVLLIAGWGYALAL